ncbi:hypothetical protein EV126DRAFT_253714 [Verticillium dahliae]|nr:hypothetical protein EV126DRAFT_253714 [Verticillium dahliae]
MIAKLTPQVESSTHRKGKVAIFRTRSALFFHQPHCSNGDGEGLKPSRWPVWLARRRRHASLESDNPTERTLTNARRFPPYVSVCSRLLEKHVTFVNSWSERDVSLASKVSISWLPLLSRNSTTASHEAPPRPTCTRGQPRQSCCASVRGRPSSCPFRHRERRPAGRHPHPPSTTIGKYPQMPPKPPRTHACPARPASIVRREHATDAVPCGATLKRSRLCCSWPQARVELRHHGSATVDDASLKQKSDPTAYPPTDHVRTPPPPPPQVSMVHDQWHLQPDQGCIARARVPSFWAVQTNPHHLRMRY